MSVVQTQCEVGRAGQAGGLERTVIWWKSRGGEMEVGAWEGRKREREKEERPGRKGGDQFVWPAGLATILF